MGSYVVAVCGLIRHEKVGDTKRYYSDWGGEIDNVITGKFVQIPGCSSGDEEVQLEYDEYKAYGIFWKFRELCHWVSFLGHMVGCDVHDPSTFDETTPFYEIFKFGPEAIYGPDVCAKLAADFAVWEAHYLQMRKDDGYSWIRGAFEFARDGRGAVSLCSYAKRKSKDVE